MANAGGVIVSYLEWVQSRSRYRWKHERVIAELEELLGRAWDDVVERSEQDRVSYRLAAYQIALDRVSDAIELRGFGGAG